MYTGKIIVATGVLILQWALSLTNTIPYKPMTPQELQDVRKKIGAALQKKRESLKISPNRLGNLSGIGHHTISKIEGGMCDFRFDTLIILSRTLRQAFIDQRNGICYVDKDCPHHGPYYENGMGCPICNNRSNYEKRLAVQRSNRERRQREEQSEGSADDNL